MRVDYDFLVMTNLGVRLPTLFMLLFTLQAAELKIEVAEPPTNGVYRLMVFDSANAFGDFRDPVYSAEFLVDEPISVSSLPAGLYAWVMYHDENGNGFLDENFIGIPKEPLALSNGYFPKGPPNFQAATIELREGEPLREQVSLRRPLGKLGRIGLGIGMIGRGSVYKGFDGTEFQAIPAITYLGERFQIFGPNAQLGLAGAGDLRLALAAGLEIGAYEDSESPALEGLGDRKTTLFVGPSLQYDGPRGIDMSIKYQHDILDQIGGGRAGMGIGKSFQVGRVTIGPDLGLNWISEDVANHLYGVPTDRKTESRPAYNLDAQVSIEAGVRGGIFISSNSQLILNIGYEWLGEDVKDSPIVDEKGLFKGFAAVAYVF